MRQHRCGNVPVLLIFTSNSPSGVNFVSLWTHSITFLPLSLPWGSLNGSMLVHTGVIVKVVLQLTVQSLKSGPLTGLCTPALQHQFIEIPWAGLGLRESVSFVQHLDYLVSWHACQHFKAERINQITCVSLSPTETRQQITVPTCRTTKNRVGRKQVPCNNKRPQKPLRVPKLQFKSTSIAFQALHL